MTVVDLNLQPGWLLKDVRRANARIAQWGPRRPARIQRKRAKGWRMPANAIYVGRPTIFGNPFIVGQSDPLTGKPMTAEAAAAWYRRGIEGAIKAWTGDVGSIFRPEMDIVYDAWEARAPHLRYAEIETALADIRGCDLCCWCSLDAACHADVLLKIANQ